MLKLQSNTAGDTMPYVIGGGLEERSAVEASTESTIKSKPMDNHITVK